MVTEKINPAGQPLVSIVTPMYNGAEFLAECIESILAQTYQNWEYTIVDNCSKDGSAEIARQYAARDARIRVHINQEFVPAIANHNIAMRQTSPSSKYCKVVFADDWIYPECLEKMVAAAEQHPSAGIVGAYCLEGDQLICTGLPYANKLLGGRETCRRHLLERLHLFGSANTLLYRADLVRARPAFFNEANIHADTEICFDLLRGCDFAFVHQVLTFTRLRAGSLNTVSLDNATYFPDALLILANYGSDYLTKEEIATYRRRHLAEYYRFLGKSLFRRRDSKFWDVHRRQLMQWDSGLSRIRLVRGAFEYILNAALNPGETFFKWLKTRDFAGPLPS